MIPSSTFDAATVNSATILFGDGVNLTELFYKMISLGDKIRNAYAYGRELLERRSDVCGR